MKRKGFTLVELLVIMTVSSIVLGMVFLTYSSITNSIARQKAQAETEQYLNTISNEMTRLYASAKWYDTPESPILIETIGYFNKAKITESTYSYTFSTTFGFNDAIYSAGGVFGDVLILAVFRFESPYNLAVKSSTVAGDYHRALGVSNIVNDEITQRSNLVYVDYIPGEDSYRVMPLTTKPERLWIRNIILRPSQIGGLHTMLDISVGARHYLKRAKHSEDNMSRHDPYNYETTKRFTLLLRGF